MMILLSYLVAGLVKLLGVEGGTDTEGEALVDLGVVGERSNAAVVDLGLIGFGKKVRHLPVLSSKLVAPGRNSP